MNKSILNLVIFLASIVIITTSFFIYFVVKNSNNEQGNSISINQENAKPSVPEEKTAKILFFGDMMLDRNVRKQINLNGADYLFEKIFGEVGISSAGFDLIAANLEGPFANRRIATTKSIAFRFDPVLLPVLKKYGFTLFDNANNHSYDMGSRGFEDSNINLKNAGFDFYGSQYKIDDGSMIIKQAGDLNIAFIGINDTNSPVDISEVKGLIGKAHNTTGTDFIILNTHWGDEYKEISNQRQRQLAHDFIDAGVDAIIGHHPHVVEEMEMYKDKPIFYSLGNFIFDQYFSQETQQGFAVGLALRQDKEKKNISFDIYPFKGIKSQVSLMDGSEKQNWFKGWIAKSRLGDKLQTLRTFDFITL